MVRCRVVACREALDDGKSWSFYLINDSAAVFETAELDSIEYEWGNISTFGEPNVRVAGLAPGAHALIWRDDDSHEELRIELQLLIHAQGRDVRLMLEFPMLYKIAEFPFVKDLGKPGFARNAAEA